jgi:hypothetical protein
LIFFLLLKSPIVPTLLHKNGIIKIHTDSHTYIYYLQKQLQNLFEFLIIKFWEKRRKHTTCSN